ncbi:hypothetical protein GcM3_109025 [Golovinomyces cichoracearum]|uniref:Uncharacterized protein n=1 Tax=Golovinomyces cichoracearum TaxID=62708 RepID=A0A420I965_9PEZI|nr:hypothetical protein GcM3_109025 [Golovinomyces cichoracearum]
MIATTKIPLPNLQSTLREEGHANRAVQKLIKENVSPEFMGIFPANVDMCGQNNTFRKKDNHPVEIDPLFYWHRG